MGISDLVVDHLSALEYVTKYATKQEKGSKASEQLIGQIDQPEDPSHITKAAWIYAQRVAAARASAAKRMVGSVPMTSTERIRRWRQARAPAEKLARREIATLARRQSRLAAQLARKSVHPHPPAEKEEAHAQLTGLSPH